MARSRRKRRIIAALLVLCALVGMVVYLILSIPPSPEPNITAARQKLTEARDNQADVFAPKEYQHAQAIYDSAMTIWQRENQRFLPWRDYESVIDYADSALALSVVAIEKAAHNARTAKQKSHASIDKLSHDLKRVGKLYSPLPLKEDFRKSFNKARLLLEEARIARNKGDYNKAIDITTRAGKLLTEAERIADKRVKDYFGHYQEWQKLYKDAIAASAKQNNTLIVVEKLAYRILVYKDGKLKSEFKTEYGPNWLGVKNHQGDGATPEGMYRVTKKKERGATIYYKALLINYPNTDDMTRYKGKVRSGEIPRHVDVGGLIEIHGHGGRGFNWTNGCVALADKDMDVVYRLASVNTPVLIVGSLVPYETWHERSLTNTQ